MTLDNQRSWLSVALSCLLDAWVYMPEYVRTFFFTHNGPHKYYHAACFSNVSQAFPRIRASGLVPRGYIVLSWKLFLAMVSRPLPFSILLFRID